jgi:hypothetical protein
MNVATFAAGGVLLPQAARSRLSAASNRMALKRNFFISASPLGQKKYGG